MSLRQARFDDHWRRVYAKTYPTRFTEIAFDNLYCLSDGAISFSAGISAIVGGNGVGKSTVAAAIAELLKADPNSAEAGYSKRSKGSTLRGKVVSGGIELHLGTGDGESGKRVSIGDNFVGECRWLDPSALANRSVVQIHADQNFLDNLEPLTALKLGADELLIVSYLVGKNYDSIKIYEVADYGEFDRFPYFSVESAGVKYGNEGMGRGELGLLLTYWTVRDMAASSILLLEEPETHVSPKSQDALMNILAKVSDERAIWVIVTTHSPTVIRNIPAPHLKLLVRNEGRATITPAATKLDIGLLLGGGVALNGLILVEDVAAKGFVHSTLEAVDPDMLRQFRVAATGSESDITHVLKSMPAAPDLPTVFGVYDGDMKEKIVDDGYQWRYSFLPGDASPEELLIQLVQSTANIANAIGQELNRPAERITMALEHVQGADHHDYFRQLGDFLNIETAAIQRAFVRIWLSQQGNLGIAKTLIDEIRLASKDWI